MKKRLVITLVIFFILLAGAFSYYGFYQEKACIEEQCFKVEVADTPDKRSRGLMYRKSMKEDRGMFFIFEESKKHDFWMKNTKIPLDIIWINSDMEIVGIKNKATPCEKRVCETYKSNENSRYVLEINAGLAEKHGFEKGDKVNTSNVF